MAHFPKVSGAAWVTALLLFGILGEKGDAAPVALSVEIFQTTPKDALALETRSADAAAYEQWKISHGARTIWKTVVVAPLGGRGSGGSVMEDSRGGVVLAVEPRLESNGGVTVKYDAVIATLIGYEIAPGGGLIDQFPRVHETAIHGVRTLAAGSTLLLPVSTVTKCYSARGVFGRLFPATHTSQVFMAVRVDAVPLVERRQTAQQKPSGNPDPGYQTIAIASR